MKKIWMIIMVFSLLTLISCEKPLNPIIKSDITESNFFQNEADINAAVVASYGPFRQFYSGAYSVAAFSYWAVCVFSSGEFIQNPAYQDVYYIHSNFQWQATDDNGDFYLAYLGRYVQYVTQCSKTIVSIENSKVSEAIKNKYIGELLALRAWNSFIIYDLFDPLPLVNTDEKVKLFIDNPNDPSLFTPPSEAQRVLDIEADLLKAIDLLPSTAPEGRMSKGVARTMLLKLYMQEKQWAKAESMARAIKAMNYAPQATYKAVFAYNNQNNSEIIWGIPGSRALYPGQGFINDNMWRAHATPYNFPSLVSPTKDNWDVWRMSWPSYDRFAANDKRKDIIYTQYISKEDGSLISGRNGILSWGPVTLKYWEEDPSSISYAEATNFIVFRLADVDLLLAEAINEQVGPTAEAAELVNFYRNRAGVSTIDPVNFNQGSFRDFIFNERFFELWGEGSGRLDLIRHGTFLQAAIARGVPAQTKHLKLPIPSKFIIQSKGIIKQRPGY